MSRLRRTTKVVFGFQFFVFDFSIDHSRDDVYICRLNQLMEKKTMMNDIRDRDDIALLINRFYDKVKANETIGYIFNDVAKVNWEHHLPIMYDFWENVLFQTGTYVRNAIAVHKNLNKITPLKREHFEEWLTLWKQTVVELFEGPNAELVKQRAQSIATIMQISIVQGGISKAGA